MKDFSCPKRVGDYVVDIDIDDMLGEGLYGKVYKGYQVRTE